MAATQETVQTLEMPIIRPVMPELDTIRGIAILGVVFYHLLYLGVDTSRLPHAIRTMVP